MSKNYIGFEGRITRDAELKETPNGKLVCNFSLARTVPQTVEKGGDNEKTIFVDVECWGKLAERLAHSLTKGRYVSVKGSISQNRWTNSEDQKRSKLYILAEGIHFGLDSEESSNEATNAAESEA